MSVSSIEWTDYTWNPARGCTKISPGCAHCYAKDFMERFRGVPGHAFEHGFDPRLAPDKLTEPLKLVKPRRIFVNSMSDLFHEEFQDDYLVRVARVMQEANWHTFQVLTKRPERMKALLETKLNFAACLPHIWWGVSVEDNAFGLPRIDILRRSPACVRFLSVEPLLERLQPLGLSGIDWVIVGGESGPKARPCLQTWVTEIRDACHEQGVAFFFKQWGGRYPKAHGRVLEGRTHDDMPPFGTMPVAGRAQRENAAATLQWCEQN